MNKVQRKRHKFSSKSINRVIITLGVKGVFVSTQGESKMISGFSVQDVDTTAAGDTFNGSFVSALLENKSFEEVIRLGQVTAAISVTRKGTRPSIPN